MVDIPYVVIDSIAIFLIAVPSPWHLAAWNSATCYMMLWTMIGCVIHLVNSIIWYHSLGNPSPTYCDITTKLAVGLSIAIPLSSLCINRRLYNIATMSSVAVTKAQKRRDVIIDTLVAVVAPMIFMAVHYTMQGHRYDVMENYGCWPSTYLTAPAYVLVIAPPVLVCAISLIFALLSLRVFIRRRTEFSQLLKTSSTGLNPGRYFRLMALASAEVLLGLPMSLYFLVTDLRSMGVAPWISWEDTHYNFSQVMYYPAYFFKLNRATHIAFELNRWTFPFISLIFFVFFGVGEEARKNYRRAFYAALRPFGVQPPATTSNTSSKGGKFFSSKASPDSAASLDTVISSLPPRYTSPTKPTSSSWSHSTFDLSPTLDVGTYRADADEKQLTPATPDTTFEPHDYDAPILNNSPPTTIRSVRHHVPPLLHVQVTTTTHTSADNLV